MSCKSSMMWSTRFMLIMQAFCGQISNVMSCNQSKISIQYPRFTKLIIANLMEKYQSIPKRLDEEYHTTKDDTPLCNMYTTREVTVRGVEVLMIQPKPVESTQGTIRTPRAIRTPNCDVVKQKKEGKQIVGESSTPKQFLKIRIRSKHTLATPLPLSDDAERDDIIKATQLSLAKSKTTKVYEEQQNATLVENKIIEEDVEKLVEGNDESTSDEFDDTKILSDEDSDDRIEPVSHKENPKETVDDDEKNDDNKHGDAKNDENKDDNDDNDDDNHIDH
ncbi:hypothetical protein Tco_1510480 [Tanacetum coccineum]